MSNNNSTNYTDDEYQLNAIGGRKCLKGRRSLKRQQQREQRTLLFTAKYSSKKVNNLILRILHNKNESE